MTSSLAATVVRQGILVSAAYAERRDLYTCISECHGGGINATTCMSQLITATAISPNEKRMCGRTQQEQTIGSIFVRWRKCHGWGEVHGYQNSLLRPRTSDWLKWVIGWLTNTLQLHRWCCGRISLKWMDFSWWYWHWQEGGIFCWWRWSDILNDSNRHWVCFNNWVPLPISLTCVTVPARMH